MGEKSTSISWIISFALGMLEGIIFEGRPCFLDEIAGRWNWRQQCAL